MDVTPMARDDLLVLKARWDLATAPPADGSTLNAATRAPLIVAASVCRRLR